MLKRVGLFGVRRRVNEIVEFINEVNEQEEVDISAFIDSVTERLDAALDLFGLVFRKIVSLRRKNKELARRVKVLEKQQTRELDDESLSLCLETVEGLDVRLSALEDHLFGKVQDETHPDNPEKGA